MLILHHLGISQSERVVWLLEELDIPYEIVYHTRDPLAAPDSLKNVPGNITGKAPFLYDNSTNTALSESAAIVEYIIHRYGGGRLSISPSDKNYPAYIQSLHFANATLQASLSVNMFLIASGADPAAPIVKLANDRMQGALRTLDQRLQGNKWLAGDDFSAADILTLYCTTTQRYWASFVKLDSYKNILRWMKDCGERPAYQKAMQKGDPEMRLLLTVEGPTISMVAAGGVKSDHWKKSSANL